MTGKPVAVGVAGGVPASSSDVPKVASSPAQCQESPRFLNILNKEVLLRTTDFY